MQRSFYVLVLAGCAGASSQPQVQFANAPAARVVDDRRDVPRPPAERKVGRYLYHFDGTFTRPLRRNLSMSEPYRARGVNALDDVPDSTWFTNRIGTRSLSLDDLRAGAAVVGSPEGHTPWTIESTKVGGVSVGFVITDARGERFLLKFDDSRFPEIESAADAITSRILWASGYNVPEDHVVYVRPEELVLSPTATIRDVFGTAWRLDAAEVQRRLAQVEREPDGRMRALASRILDGTPLGGHAGEGVREDDPNDRIPHQLRRDLRGARAIFAWLDHADIKEGNTLDMWVADPAKPSHHYVKHYFLDFGKSLGYLATFGWNPRRGHEYALDYTVLLESLVSLGMAPRPWLDRRVPPLRGVGLYDITAYDPGTWKPYTPAYTPFQFADRFDQFWGAKILMRFTRPQLQAIVETARLTDPRASAYLVEALVARQRKTAAYWFARVSPLDGFEAAPAAIGTQVCFDDLALVHQLAPAAGTHYVVTNQDRAGRPIGQRVAIAPAATGRTCTGPIGLSNGPDGYTVVRIDTRRHGTSLGVLVHLARDPGRGTARVIGVWRL